jgi:transcriptional regulator with XRE-family HTH domain
MDTLGKRIKEKRKAERLSAEDLAVKLGTKKENIYKWEEGAKPSDPEIFSRLNGWLANTYFNTNKSEQQPENTISFREHLEAVKEQKRMAEQYAKELKEIIIAQLTGLDHKLTAAGKNLDAALAAAFQQSLTMDAMGSTVLESLARLEKKKPDSLVLEAGRKQHERAKKEMQRGKNYVENK